jgi:hypothetical protein
MLTATAGLVEPNCRINRDQQHHLHAQGSQSSSILVNPQLLLVTLVLVGFGLRFVPLWENRNLWIDEAMLALNVVERSPQELMQPLDWNQGAPLGFLLLSKTVCSSLGLHEWALRLVPFVGSLIGLSVFAWVAQRCLPMPSAIGAVALYAVSPYLVSYAAEFKQYSTDAAITICLFALALGLLHGQGGITRWIVLALGGALAIWCSHPSVFVLGGIGLALGSEAVIRRNWKRLLACSATSAVWLTSLAVCYRLVLKHLGANRYLQDYWMGHFMPVPRSVGDLAWLAEHYFELFRNPGGLGGQALGTAALSACLFLTGIVALVRQCRPIALAVVVPGGLALLASAMHKYPFAGRLLLFLVPLLLLPVARGGWGVFVTLRTREPVMAWLVLAVVLIGPLYETAKLYRQPLNCEDLASALQYLRAHIQSDDVVYVYPGAIPAFQFYTRDQPLPARVHLGDHHRDQPTGYQSELRNFVGKPRVWLVFSHRHAHEEPVIRAYAEGFGPCNRHIQFRGAAVYLFDFQSLQ